jgi:hypothetical protein
LEEALQGAAAEGAWDVEEVAEVAGAELEGAAGRDRCGCAVQVAVVEEQARVGPVAGAVVVDGVPALVGVGAALWDDLCADDVAEGAGGLERAQVRVRRALRA